MPMKINKLDMNFSHPATDSEKVYYAIQPINIEKLYMHMARCQNIYTFTDIVTHR